MLNYQLCNNHKQNWIVFIHGLGGSILTWKKQISFFSKKYNLLLLDLPGHGLSNKYKTITVDEVNAKIKEVLDKCEIKEASFIGLSLGTLVVANFAVQYPQYIKNIIFGGAAINLHGLYRPLMRLINLFKNCFHHRIFYKMFANIMLPKKNHKISRHIFIRESKKMNRKVFYSWIKYISQIANAKNLLNKLKNLNINMLFISGDEDFCFLRGTKNAAYIIQSKIQIIKKCGHVCTIEKADEFNKIALKFLNAAYA